MNHPGPARLDLCSPARPLCGERLLSPVEGEAGLDGGSGPDDGTVLAQYVFETSGHAPALGKITDSTGLARTTALRLLEAVERFAAELAQAAGLISDQGFRHPLSRGH
ncbi:hypothetical protein ACGFNV_34870 [Streptomyces sp. NPDC048751]|uniref:hypothetical protein n=1 Tax=Streptomyces sp. NPDC048751 TaxID=3365591 RepID=UPI00371F1DC1